MEYTLKTRIYNFLCKHNDNSKEAKNLIREMKYELDCADIPGEGIMVEDLENRDSEILREKLGKKDNEPYTIVDCIRVANAYADIVSDEFGENIQNTIEYEL